MENPEKKIIIGILGGIGSGKSAVAAEFARLGCCVIDADKIVHELLKKPETSDKIIKRFGQGILDETGKIDRRKLAEKAFEAPESLESLTGILHPPVLSRVEELIEQYNGQAEVKAIVLDIPLLAEVGWEKRCDKLVFVDCKAELRADRAKAKGLFDERQLKIRENFQISLDKKKAMADNIIDNNSGFSSLVKQVAEIFLSIIGKE